MATPEIQASQNYVGHAAGFLAEIPADWTADRSGDFQYAGRDGGVISGIYYGDPMVQASSQAPPSLESACASLTGPTDPVPAIEVWKGARACTIRDASFATWHLDTLLFEQPHPTEDDVSRLVYVTVDHPHFDVVVASITFDTASLTAGVYLDSALDGMETTSVWRDLIDWGDLRDEATAMLGSRATSTDTSLAWPVIEYALSRLASVTRDGHHDLRLPTDTPVEAAGAITPPTGTLPAPGISQLILPGFVGTPERALEYVTAGREAIANGVAADTCGWIVDLRPNPGGIVYPMIGALAPLLSPGVIIGFRDVHGDLVEVEYLGNGAITYDDVPYYLPPVQTDGFDTSLLSTQPVAVLIGPGTASAGEATAVVLAGRNNTRFLGQATADMATAPAGLPLIDGAVIVLAVSRYVGPLGATYDDGIQPDIEVFEVWGGTDDVVAAAITWLNKQPGCSGTKELG